MQIDLTKVSIIFNKTLGGKDVQLGGGWGAPTLFVGALSFYSSSFTVNFAKTLSNTILIL